MGYLEKDEDEDSFFFAGLIGYREKDEDGSFLLTGLIGYLDEDPWFFAGLLSGRVWTGPLFWNCWGYG